MRKIVIQKDKLPGTLFNEKSCVLYKKWFAVFMNDNFTQYMRSINDENIQWLSLATVKSSFENWVQQQIRFQSGEEEVYEKNFCEDTSVILYGGQILGTPLSTSNLIFLLMDYLTTLYILEDAVTNDTEDVHNNISLWNVFVPGRLSQWGY
jgi:hypothetical protein